LKETIQQHPIAFRALSCFLLMYAFITLLAGYGLGDANGETMALQALIPLAGGAALAYLCAAYKPLSGV
jgi:hypothetical protein